MTRELGVYACPSCLEHPADWYRWAASEGREWPEGNPVAEWVELILDTTVCCIACGPACRACGAPWYRPFDTREGVNDDHHTR